MTSYNQSSSRDSRKPKSSDIGHYRGEFSCLDWVEDVVIQQLIQELGLANRRELPDLKQLLVFQPNEDIGKPVTFERSQLR